MQRHIYTELNETLVTHTLENGLEIVIIQKPDFMTSSFYFAIPYGSLDLNQVVDGQTVVSPSGIAHFLEHKLFENNNGTDIMEAFSSLSANVNAFTSHTETVYTFSTSRKNISKPLNLLMDFVQNLSITDTSVEKEKGIIIQELRMYMNMPEQRLVFETYQSLYATHPIRLDIGGTEESVKAITKSALETCYSLNYHPSHSLLVAVTSHDPNTIISIIEENQARKTFPKRSEIIRALEYEPKTINRPYFEFTMDIQATKLTYAFKLDCMHEDHLTNLKQEWSLRILLELIFSATNPAYQSWIASGRIHDYFGYEIEINHEYGFVLFFGENDHAEDFKTLIHEGLAMDVTELLSDIDALKRRYFALMLRSLDDHDDYALSYIRSRFNKIPFEKQLEIVKEISVDDILESRKLLETDERCIVVMKGLKNSQE